MAGANHNALYAPALVSLIRLVRDCRIGELHHVSVSLVVPPASLPMRDAGQFMFQDRLNMVFELGPHPMSIIHRLMGRDLQVSAVASDERTRGRRKAILLHLAGRRGDGARHGATVPLRGKGEDGVIQADLRRHSVKVPEVPDAAETLKLAMDAPGIEGQAFTLAGDVFLSTREYSEMPARETRRDFRFRPQNLELRYAYSALKSVLLRLAAGRELEDTFRDMKSSGLFRRIDNSRSKPLLGWKPNASREVFIEQAIRSHIQPSAPGDLRLEHREQHAGRE